VNALTRWVRAFGAFWWDFIVGDDWRIAFGVVSAFVVTGLLAHVGVPAWWVVPVVALTMLAASVTRAAVLAKRE